MRRAVHGFLIAGLVAVCVAAQFFPLFNSLGYEYGVAAGIYLYLAGGLAGFWLMRNEKDGGGAASSILVRASTKGLWWLLFAHGIAVAISLANALRVKNCDPAGGLANYLFVAVPASALGFNLGLLGGALTRRLGKMIWMLVGFGLFSAALTLGEQYFGPRVALHNLILGQIIIYSYNSSKTLYGTFIWHRAFGLLLALWLWGLAYARAAREGADAGERRTALSFLAFTTLLWAVPALFLSDLWGITPGNRLVAGRLNTRLESPHIVLQYSAEEFRTETARRILAELEWAYAKDAEAMGLNLKWKIVAYLYSPASKEELTGGRDVLFAQPWRHAIHITGNLDDYLLRHELTHTMAADFGRWPWGVPWNMGIIEGLAEAVSKDQIVAADTHTELAAALKAGHLPDPKAFMTNGGFMGSVSYQSYSLAGSFVGFLGQRYGMEKLKALYQGTTFRIPFEEVYGKSLPELGAEWKAFLGTVAVPPNEVQRANVNFNREFAPVFYSRICPRERDSMRGEGRQLRANGNTEKALATFEEFAKSEPRNPDWVIEIAQTHLAAKAYGPAAEAAQKVIDAQYPAFYQLQALSIFARIAVAEKDPARLKNALEKEVALTTDPFAKLRLQLELKALDRPDGQKTYDALESSCGRMDDIRKLSEEKGFEDAALLTLTCRITSAGVKDAGEIVRRYPPATLYGELIGRQAINLGAGLYNQGDWDGAEAAWTLAQPYAGPTLRLRLERLLDKNRFVRQFLKASGNAPST